jgi:peptidoglycan-associated lipoprotein
MARVTRPKTLQWLFLISACLVVPAPAGSLLSSAMAQVRTPWDYDVTLTGYPQAKWKALTSYIDKPAFGDVTDDGIPEIIAASVFGDVYCVDGTTGQLLWAYEDEHAFDIAIYICPALVDVNCDKVLDVVSVTPRGVVLCLDGRTGRRLWGFQAEAPTVYSPSAFDLDRNGVPEIAVADLRGGLYLISHAGEQLWKVASEVPFYGAPAMGLVNDQPVVLMSDRGGALRSFDGASGNLLWRQAPSASRLSTSPVAFKDAGGPEVPWKVLVGTEAGEVHLVNAQSGALIWTRTMAEKEVVGDFSVGDLSGDGLLDFAFSTSGSRIMAANVANGAVLWSKKFKVPVKEFMQVGGRKKIARDVLTGQPIVVDLDGDGRLDIIVDVRGLNNYVFGLQGIDGKEEWVFGNKNLLLNPALNESATIACCQEVPPGTYATTVPSYSQPTPILADFDGDGRADLIVNDRDEVGLISVPLPAKMPERSWPKYMAGSCNNNVNFALPCLGTAALPKLSLTVEPREIFRGETARLCWTSTGADEIKIDGGVGAVKPVNCAEVRPQQNTTWRAVALGCGGQAATEIALLVKAPPPALEAWSLEDVYFEYDWYRLTPDAIKTLDENIRKLKAHPAARIALEATCDERGSRIYNQFLAEERAEAVRQYLMENGIDPSRIEIRSMGESLRWDPRLSDQGWALNRRVHFVILP